MSSQKSITGGYYLKARKIKDSAIAHAAPHVREVWDWLIMAAQHKPYRASDKTIERGQVLTTYEEISTDLHWMVGFIKKTYKKHHIDFSMRWLREHDMITTQRTTRGFIVTVCNYDTYQTPTNYDYDKVEAMITTPLRLGTDTINKNDKNNKNDNKEILGGEGGLAPLHATPAGFHYLPDGRSYIEPTIFFSATDFNGLPQENTSAVKTFIETINNVEIEEKKILDLWEVFKVQELTFQKPYRNKEDVYRHFLNWAKKQSFKKGASVRTKTPPRETKNQKVVGVKWLDNFTRCEMSDGSIQNLTTNQMDAAKYNQISPSAIVKI